jgi:hypothetical protein
LKVIELKETQLADTMYHGAKKCKAPTDYQEQVLRPHQVLLCPEAPSDQDAIVARRSIASGAQDEERMVNCSGDDRPSHGYAES